MNKHMDVILTLTLYKEKLGLNNKELLKQIVSEILDGIELRDHDIPSMVQSKFMPKTQEWVHALVDQGFSNDFITQYLGISKQAVSYHRNRPLDRDYKNIAIAAIIQRETPVKDFSFSYDNNQSW